MYLEFKFIGTPIELLLCFDHPVIQYSELNILAQQKRDVSININPD